MKHNDHLAFYRQQSVMTAPGRYARLYETLPRGLAELCTVVQGLAIHEFVAEPMYGFKVPDARRNESHLRRTEQLLERILELDARPLTVARPPGKRLVGVCHHFMLLLVSMLRAQGVPARARCGFGSYFNPGFYEDHWVCEYWNEDEARWVLADPQFDEVWRANMHTKHDVLDVPRDRFLVAGDAWALCRSGQADPSTFGIFRGNLRGLWFVAGDLVHDLAALNSMEMLPWDVWGAMPQPDAELGQEQLAYFEGMAALSQSPDHTFGELQTLYQTDPRLTVPSTVFNAVLDRPEPIA